MKARVYIGTSGYSYKASDKTDIPRLDNFLSLLPHEHRHAVEFRDRSWYDAETFETLCKHNASHVALSSGGMPVNLTVTSDNLYPIPWVGGWSGTRLHAKGT